MRGWRNPAARRQARCRRAPAEGVSRVDTVLDASQEIFDQFQAGGRSHQIDRPPLIKTGRGLLEPLLGSCLGAEQWCRSRQNLRKLPGTPALFLTKQFRRM